MPSSISVYITSYNQEKYLSQAVESVLAQTVTPAEIIIIDDCSTDGSFAILESWQNRYPGLIRIERHTQNQGVAATRNHAIQLLKGDFITHLDGDDRFLPNKLEHDQVFLGRHPDLRVCHGNFYFIDATGQRYRRWVRTDREELIQNILLETYAFALPQNVHFRNEVVHRSVFEQAGNYDEKLQMYEDYDFRTRLASRFAVGSIPAFVSEYRKHGEGLSDRRFEEHIETILGVASKNRGLLANLQEVDRKKAQKLFYKFVAQIYRKTAIHSALAKVYSIPGKVRAVRLYSHSLRFDPCLDPKLAAAILLPPSIFYKLGRSARTTRTEE